MKLYCFSRENAGKFYKRKGWTDSTLPDNVAIISIAGTLVSQVVYLKNLENHWFREKDNVLNLNFDDTPKEVVTYKGVTFYGLTDEDALRTVLFIYNNLDKDIYVNCTAGKSRSQSIVRFILDTFPYLDFETNPKNPPITPNIFVLSKLKRIVRENYLDVLFDLKRVGIEVEEVETTKYKVIGTDDIISYYPFYIDEGDYHIEPEKYVVNDDMEFKSLEELAKYVHRGQKS